ncbi:MAG TPA: cation-translocating P-type ATPase [Longimicrobiales bacterium]|nr:cation-translocating P-type ATPase [Longimicrobiales bacterium]
MHEATHTRASRTAAEPAELHLRVRNMDCASCLAKIEAHLGGLEGVAGVRGSVVNRTIAVTLGAPWLTERDVRREIGRLGYVAQPLEGGPGSEPTVGTWRTPQALRVYAATAIALLAALTRALAGEPVLLRWGAWALTAPDAWLVAAALVAGWSFFPKGLAAARRLSLDMNFLMTAAIIGAVLLGEFVEAAAIAVLFGVAELLETYSVDRARASIESLMELAPDSAVVLRDGVETTVAASLLVPGDVMVVRPGDRIAADGVVLEGASAVDQSPITGESLPVEKAPGDGVFSGTINKEGHLRIRVERPAGESALAKIVRLVEEAERVKTRSERFVERFARAYTPVITVAAVAAAALPPLLAGADAVTWVTRGLTLLVIACPCALVISTPVAVVSGITAAARHGVLIKGGAYLEALGSVRTFALDKTGTLTVGHPVVREVRAAAGEDENDALARAAAVERLSEHPLARAIVEEAERRRLPALSVEGFEALPGVGARGRIDGEEHVVGRPRLFPGSEPPAGLEGAGLSVVGVARGGEVRAWIALADRPREHAAGAVSRLRGLGVERVLLLTGDNRATASAVAAAVGIDDVHAELLPADKLRLLMELEKAHGSVAMVGDGVNDGPALAAATVGIAMGAAGSDTALETADVALMGDDLGKLPYLVRLSRRARGVIRENIAAAIAIKVVLAIGVPLGWVSLITAVLVGDMGVSLAVTLNALRLGRVRD